MSAPLTLDEYIAAAKASLEAHALFAGGRVPVLTNYVAPGERNTAREAIIRDKGACLELSPFLRDRLVDYKAPSVIVIDSTLSVAIRLSPTLGPGDAPLLPLTLNTAFVAVALSMIGVGFQTGIPHAAMTPEQELGQLIEDAEGLLSKALFFTARTHHKK